MGCECVNILWWVSISKTFYRVALGEAAQLYVFILGMQYLYLGVLTGACLGSGVWYTYSSLGLGTETKFLDPRRPFHNITLAFMSFGQRGTKGQVPLLTQVTFIPVLSCSLSALLKCKWLSRFTSLSFSLFGHSLNLGVAIFLVHFPVFALSLSLTFPLSLSSLSLPLSLTLSLSLSLSLLSLSVCLSPSSLDVSSFHLPSVTDWSLSLSLSLFNSVSLDVSSFVSLL